jgi:monoamine oxidase
MKRHGVDSLNKRVATFDRRSILRSAFYGGLLAATSLSTNVAGAFPMPVRPLASSKRVIVIGAGIAGLCSAYELEQLGYDVVILEASDSYAGGRVRTQQLGDGLYGDLGAMRIPATHNLTRHYVNKFGLKLRPFVQSNPEAYYYVRGKKVRIRDEAELNTLFQLTGDDLTKSSFYFWNKSVLSILDSLSADERADLRRVVFQTNRMQSLDRLSLEEVMRQSGMSTDAIEFFASLWAYETSLQSGITTLLREELEEVWINSFDEIVGGMSELPKAFIKKLRSKPRMGCKVTRVEQNATTGKVSAVYASGNGWERVEGDCMICTVPLSVMSRIEFLPGLSAGKMRASRQVIYDSSTKVLARTSRRFWETDDGIYGGGTMTDLPTGITYYPADNAAARDPRVSRKPAVMLASYTWGQPARRLAAFSADERHEVTLRNLSKVHPQLREKDMVEKVVSWSWDTNPLSAGAFCWFAPGQHDALYRDVVSAEGRIFFAGEHASLTHTWIQGAIESAHRVVQEVGATI